MAQDYKYEPLDEGSIRLLELSGQNEELRGKIHHVSLTSHPTYKALSYVWGNPTLCRRISIEGNILNVTENLAIALRHLTKLLDTYIWIDAICINQRDDQEKGQQVNQMGKIYRQAAQVIVWLGPSSEESDRAMDGLNTYGREAFDAGALELTAPILKVWPDVGDDPRLIEIRSRLVEIMVGATNSEECGSSAAPFPRIPFARLTHRSYFERAWVKQELTLGTELIMVCGEKTTLSLYFHAALIWYGLWAIWEIDEWRNKRLSRMPGPFTLEQLMEALQASGGDPQAAHKLNEQAVANPACVQFFAHRKKYHNPGNALPLMDYLKNYVWNGLGGLKASDPRDRIYALLGIAADADELGIYPDYSQDPELLYEKLARALIGQGHVDILTYCRSQKLKLPSWVPDWTALTNNTWSDDGTWSLFSASPTAPPRLKPDCGSSSETSGVLQMRGIRIDAILECGSVWAAPLKAPFNLAAARTLFAEVKTFLGVAAKYAPAERTEAAWRIPVGDKETHPKSGQWQRATPKSGEEYKVLATGEGQLTEDEVAGTFSYQTMMGYTYDARPFLSSEGFVGLCPKEAARNDVVYILLGGRVPLVLRPKAQAEGETQEHASYTLIGEAYVHGIMDGEIFAQDNVDASVETIRLC